MRRCPHGQVFFDRGDQLRNTDGLGKKWMPLDTETTLLPLISRGRKSASIILFISFRYVVFFGFPR